MKKILKILVIAVAVLAVVSFSKDIIVKFSVEKGVELVTGLKLAIRSMGVGVIKTAVDIKGLKLQNPAGFRDRTMVDMPEIYVNYDLPAVIGGRIHLPEVHIALKEFVVVKNEKGELNLNSLRAVQAQKQGKSPSQTVSGKAPDIKIDLLMLSIGKVIYKDYSKGREPDVKEFNINLNESYTDIDNPYSLVSLIVVKALMNTTIASLTNFDLNGLKGTVGENLAKAKKMASGAMTAAKEAMASSKEQAQRVTETAKKAQDAVKNIFANPFDSGK
jgi:hypothetical protein